MTLRPAGPLDVVGVLRRERAVLVDLLRSLERSDWDQPTECPAYDVAGVAAHLLGDDLSLLARQRDEAEPGLIRFWADGGEFRAALDRFNDNWVNTVQFFSPALLVDLLEVTGQWTADWYGAVDEDAIGEPVGFFGATGPSPYWQIAAREYVERWVHQHQIRRALGRPDIGDDALMRPAVAAVMRSLAAHLGDLGVVPDTSVVLTVDRLATWTVRRGPDVWALFDGRPEDPAAEVGLDRSLATPVLSRGVERAGIAAMFALGGNRDLAQRVVAAIAVLAGR